MIFIFYGEWVIFSMQQVSKTNMVAHHRKVHTTLTNFGQFCLSDNLILRCSSKTEVKYTNWKIFLFS